MATNYVKNSRLSWAKGTAYPTAPTNLYVGLFTTAPTDASTSPYTGEVSGGAYARQAIAASTGWSAIGAGTGSNQQITNSGAITFPTATAAWGTIGWVGVFDASTNGNLLYWAAITSGSKTVNSGDTVNIAIGALQLNEA